MAKDKKKKSKKGKGKGLRMRFSPGALSVTIVWMIVFVGSVVIAIGGIIWAFLYYLQVTSNQITDAGSAPRERVETVNREDLRIAIEEIDARAASHQNFRQAGPVISEPVVVVTVVEEQPILDGEIMSG